MPPLKMASPYHHPLRSSTGASKCAKLHLELLALHHPCESGGAGLLSLLAQIPLKTEPGWSAWNSQGTCLWPRTAFPEDDKSPSTILQGAGQAWVNVPNHSQSHCPLMRHILSRARLPLKLNLGQSAQNSQGTCPMVRAASPEDINSLPPSPVEQCRCE